ncbi:MAG TPA: 3-oxoacyl-ACP synthase III [Acidimicrobiales bacterium]|nr:3-oxoacyl-ACP synthase III [Acidimicrobiales bacterium]
MSSPSAFTRAHVWSVGHAEAPEVVTSAWIDEQLAATYERCDIRPGLLESVAGIRARRWWPEDVTFDEAAARAGQVALDRAGVDPAEVDLLISTSVCKHHLEPSVACAVHHRLDLPATCANFDIGNACLGFVNAMTMAASAIESGQARTVLIVDGEGSRHTQQVTIERLRSETATVTDVFDQFASLTLGSGAAAMVMGAPRAGSHAFLGGVTRAATAHHDLCVGDLDEMRTDTGALLVSGLDLAGEAWKLALDAGWEWRDCDRYVMHQVSAVHTTKLCELLGIDPALVPLTYPDFGNMGPAAVPYTLSTIADELAEGDRVLLMGIGSGLNCSVAELVW